MDQKNRPPPMQDVKPAAGSKPDDNSFKTEIVENVPVRQSNAPVATQDSPSASNKPAAAASNQAAKASKTAEQANNKLQSGPSTKTKHAISPVVIVVLAAVVVAALIAAAYFAFSETRP